MSLGTSTRRLAKPAAHAVAAGTYNSTAAAHPTHSAGAPRQPLLPFPAFHPLPFEQEKFLSIKTRTTETFTKLRGDVMQRCTDLTGQLQRNRERAACQASRSDAGTAAQSMGSELPVPPLTPHQAEDLLQLSRKVESFSDYQGFVLPDELVWRMFHLCVQCGATRLAITEWLQKRILADQRGPPYPLLLLEDLTAVLRHTVLSRLPECGASLSCGSVLCAINGSFISAEGGHVAAQRHLQSQMRLLEAGVEEDDDTETAPRGVMQGYTSHLLQESVWPVWRSLEAMQLTFRSLDCSDKAMGEELEESGEGLTNSPSELSWLPDASLQTAAIRTALMSVTPLSSFGENARADISSSSPLGGEQSGGRDAAAGQSRAPLLVGPSTFPSAAEAVVAPLRALLGVWMAVGQCASEAKERPLLLAVQRTVALAMLTTSATNDTGDKVSPEVLVNEAGWCHYATSARETAEEKAIRVDSERAARALLHPFIGGIVSVLQYGLLSAEQEAALWQLHDITVLVMGTAALLRGQAEDECLKNASTDRAVLRDRPLSLRQRGLKRCKTMAAGKSHGSDGATAGEGEEEYARLLCEVLPRVLRRTAPTAALTPIDATVQRGITALVVEKVTGNANRQSADENEAAPYTEAGLYVGLSAGNDRLLRAAADGAGLSTTELALLIHNAQALRDYRVAAASLVEVGDEVAMDLTAGAYEETQDRQWRELIQSMEASRTEATETIEGEGVGASAQPSLQQGIDGCLQALLLHAATSQAAYAATYAQSVEAHRTDSTQVGTEEGISGGENDSDAAAAAAAAGVGDGDGDGDAHDGYGNTEAAERRQEATKQAWNTLYEGSVRTMQVVLSRAAELVGIKVGDRSGVLLSSSAMASLAVLVRAGLCVEQSADAAASASHSEISTIIDAVLQRIASDAVVVLRHATTTTSFAHAPAVTGSWLQWVLLALKDRHDWTNVLAVLEAADRPSGRGVSFLSAATVDPVAFAALYAAAQEDGAACVCALLRQQRESLFY